MKSPDEIKKGMECCVIGPSAKQPTCGECPYKLVNNCSDALLKDTAGLVQQLESDKEQLEGLLHHMNQLRDAAADRALKMEERVHQLEDHLRDARKMVERLEAERDALMGYLQSMGCDTCLHDNYDAPDSPCNDCTATRNMWVFEGVQKEDSNA